MKKRLVALSLAALAFVPAPVRADEAARLLNLQLADAVTTRVLLSHGCTFERDPLTRGTSRSNLGALGSVVVTNLLFRKIGSHGFFRIASGVEGAAVANNLRDFMATRDCGTARTAAVSPVVDDRRNF
jgi:hypothetical protein